MIRLRQVYESIVSNKLRSSVLIALVCLSVHGITVFNDYNLDDNLVTQNHRLTSKGVKAIPEIYRSPYYQDDMGYSYGYRPTTLATFAIEKELFGESPFVGHTINLLLYLTTCVLIFLLIQRIFPDAVGVALASALLFAVHPIHTEVVASIKNRDELLSLLLMLLAVNSFTLASKKHHWLRNVAFALAGVCLVGLSLSSKLSAAAVILALPFLLIGRVNFAIRLLAYGLINAILIEIIHQRSGFYPWYFLYPMLVMLILDLVRSVSFVNVARYTNDLTVSFSRLIFKTLRNGWNWTKQLINSTNETVQTSIRQLTSYFKGGFDHFIASEKSNYIRSTIFRPVTSKIPVAVSIFMLAVNQCIGSLFLLALCLIALNYISLRARFILTHLVLMTILAFSDMELTVPFLLPLLFFNMFVSENRPSFPTWVESLYVIVSLALISIDVFVVSPGEGELKTIVMMMSFYSLSVVSSWAFFRVVRMNHRSLIVAQGSVSIVSSIVLYHLFGMPFDEIMFSQFHSVVLITILTVNHMDKEYGLKPLRIYSALVITFIMLGVFSEFVAYSKGQIELYQVDWVNWIEAKKVNCTSYLQTKAFEYSHTMETFRTENIVPLVDSKNHFEFDTDYVSLTVQSINDHNSNFGRPLDFIENPIPPSSDKFLRYGFYLSTISRYLVNFFIPTDLAFYYGYNEVWASNFLEPSGILALLIIVIISITAVTLLRKGEVITGSTLVLTIICLLPFSGALEPLPGTYSPRFSYVSSVFFCSFLSASTFKLIRLGDNRSLFVFVGWLVCFSILVLFSISSIDRNRLWKNKLTLMRHDIELVSNSAQAHNLLAHAIMEQVFEDNELKDSELISVKEAATHFTKATAIYPRFFNAWVDKAKVFAIMGDFQSSIDANKKALELDTTYSPIVLQIAQAYENLGMLDSAMIHYSAYIKLEPRNFSGYDNLARILFQQSRYSESIAVCNEYLKFDPSNAAFRKNIELMNTFIKE